MRLPRPKNNDKDMTEMARQIEQADSMNYKRDRDVEMSNNRLILTSPNGSRYALTVDNAGVIGTTAL
jgi:hypothetical protein